MRCCRQNAKSSAESCALHLEVGGQRRLLHWARVYAQTCRAWRMWLKRAARRPSIGAASVDLQRRGKVRDLVFVFGHLDSAFPAHHFRTRRSRYPFDNIHKRQNGTKGDPLAIDHLKAHSPQSELAGKHGSTSFALTYLIQRIPCRIDFQSPNGIHRFCTWDKFI